MEMATKGCDILFRDKLIISMALRYLLVFVSVSVPNPSPLWAVDRVQADQAGRPLYSETQPLLSTFRLSVL
jgi:hypothetical protein